MQKRIGVIGVGAYLPEKILTNADLEKMVDTSDEWIMTRTGIKQRRIAASDVATSDLAAEAAKRALENANIKPEDIDLILVATITGDMPFPSTACLVQSKIGAKNAACFDVSAACAGYIYALSIAKEFISSGQYKNALVIGAEKLSSITDWSDRGTCVLFGDGAGASLVAPVESGGIISTYLGSDGNQAELLKVPAGGSRMPASAKTVKEGLHYLKMSGNEVFKHAVKIMVNSAKKAIEQAGIEYNEVSLFIPHQANIRILNAIAKRLEIPDEKLYLNIERYSNMSSASTAVAFSEAVKEGRIKEKDYVVLVAFGSGLTWGANVIQW